MRIRIVLSVMGLSLGLTGCSSQATPPPVDTTVAEKAAAKAQEAANRATANNKSAANARTSAPVDPPKTGAAKK